MRGQQRREQLIGVARTVFAERGYEAASIEEIAERADVSKPVVYGHFAGKERLYATIIDRDVARLHQQILQALDATHPREMIEQAAQAFLAYSEDNPDGFTILVRDAPPGRASGSLSSVIGDIARNAEQLLASEFHKHGYETAMAPLYSRALVGMVALVGQWWLEARVPKGEVVAAHLINLAWNGLKDLDPAPTAEQHSLGRHEAPRR